MIIATRPIDVWPGELRTWAQRQRAPFSARYGQTRTLLDRELRQLRAQNVVMQLAIREADLKLDGEIRANARPAEHPGVILAFDSKHGPLKYATDIYTDWQANVRAIALGLEALRKVDRYGITKRGEQYTGWSALPPATAMGPGMTHEDAARLLARAAGDENWYDDIVYGKGYAGSEPFFECLYRDAAKALHPDAGGSTEDFQRLQEAMRILREAAA